MIKSICDKPVYSSREGEALIGKADIVKTNVQVPEYKFSNQTDVSEEAQTEETEHVSKIQIRMSTIITVVVVVLVLLVLGIIIKKA